MALAQNQGISYSSEEIDRERDERAVFHRDRIARRFDAIHCVDRAAEVGSVDAIITPDQIRRSVIERLDAWKWS